MPEFHAEPYIHLAGLSHKSALITWGAFYFQTRTRHEWKLIDDQDLRHVHPPRRESIGARSDPYGPARVNVYDMTGTLAAPSFTETTNFCWIAGLASDTRYRYEIIVKGTTWAEGERWDWTPGATQGLVQRGGRYVNEFRTHPDPAAEPAGSFTFMVLGDYGTRIRKSTPTRRQREVAEAMQRTFDQHDVRLIITAGDNIYAGNRILGLPVGAQGDEDDDWFFTFFQPYRYMLNRVPVYPCIGNHDSDESEDRDDREQLLDKHVLARAHRHNFQHSSHGGIDYFVTGAGSKVRKDVPDDLEGAHTLSWADEAHFLLATIAGDTMTVRAIGELAGEEVKDLDRVTADDKRVAGPIVVQR